MEQQHNVLVVDNRRCRIRSLRSFRDPDSNASFASSVLKSSSTAKRIPSVRDLLLAVNKTLGENVYLFVNDKNVALAAREVCKLSDKNVHVIPTKDIVGGIAGLFAFRAANDGAPDEEQIVNAAARVHSAQAVLRGERRTYRRR